MADRLPSKYFSQQYDLMYSSHNNNYGQRIGGNFTQTSKFNDINNLQNVQRFPTPAMPLSQNLNYFNNNNFNIACASTTTQTHIGPQHFTMPRHRYTPYYSRSNSNTSTKSQLYLPPPPPPPPGLNTTTTSSDSGVSLQDDDMNNNSIQSLNASTSKNNNNNSTDSTVTLQISNLDNTIDDRILKQHLLAKLKPITPILSFVFEGLCSAKIRLPSQHHAKQVVAYLHRKKIGHKRITVSYTRDSSSMEPSTLRCQVAGLLKDMPNYKLALYKFRELFQSRFKTSISVMDLYEMKDICLITDIPNEEKCVVLRSELVNSIESSDLIDCLQHSVPYCSIHYKKGHRGWAEQDIEPLPNVYMTVSQVRSIVFALLKNHKDDIPIASLVYCIQGELNIKIQKNENGVNLEHLISCVNGVQITTNKFGIKILSWLPTNAAKVAAATAAAASCSNNASMMINKDLSVAGGGGGGASSSIDDASSMNGRYSKFGNMSDTFSQISREIIELIKLSPKSMMKFSRFIPAYHNHFGKQCRVADYGYTKLIELFEALPSIVQIMGDGENRQITLTHKCQVKRFTSDLMRIIRAQLYKSVMLSNLPLLFSTTQFKKFDITDYGVCDLDDIMDELITGNMVIVEQTTALDDVMISLPKRKRTRNEIQKTSIFAGEVVDMFRKASQFVIPFEKFACTYHYHFGYQCRLSDYGYLKLADLMEAITGVVEIEFSNEEDRKIYLSPKVAQRVFSEQLHDIISIMTGNSITPVSLNELFVYHKKQYGYQIVPQALGFDNLDQAILSLPYIELLISNETYYVICHHDDSNYRNNCYNACRIIIESGQTSLPIQDFVTRYFLQYQVLLDHRAIESMNHALEISMDFNGIQMISMSKMIIYVLRIIGIFENIKSVTISELKTMLNFSIEDCFPFGYPNLSTLLQDFSDIFISSDCLVNNLSDLSEIKINTECNLTKLNIQEYLNLTVSNQYSTNLQPFPMHPINNAILPQPLPQIQQQHPPLQNKFSQPSYYNQNIVSFNDLTNQFGINTIQQQLNKNQQLAQLTQYVTEQYYNGNNDGMNWSSMQSQQQRQIASLSRANKENLYGPDSELSSQFNNVKGKISQKMSTTELIATNHQKLYERKPKINEENIFNQDKLTTNGIVSDKKVSTKQLLGMYFDPPKPDTPPQKPVPFWMDPIWSSPIKSPLSESLNIPIPELKTYQVYPKLDTPSAIGILDKTKNMFAFDRAV